MSARLYVYVGTNLAFIIITHTGARETQEQ